MHLTLPRLLPLLAFALVALRAADENLIAAVRAADDERVAATLAGDRARLDAVLSADLRYAHSSGSLDTKATFIAALAEGRAKYSVVTYDERTFKPIAPGVVLMTGRGHFVVSSGGRANDLQLGFLAVWREEQGKWRFLAWQSVRLNPPAAK